MKSKIYLTAVFVVGFVFLNLQNSNAAPIYFAGTDHYYELVWINLSFASARTIAAQREYNGLPGYLVTSTSPSEDQFLRNTFAASSHYWIGGYRSGDSWAWVTDEPYAWNNNNSDGNGNYLYMYNASYWDDEPSSRSCYVVEYGTYIDDLINGNSPTYFQVIPEPATIILLIIGVLRLFGLKKNK
ncbi:PEP-CTERM sorting domain-containing protein [bacterium]|nr:PEP-CTERM sorting domain-containing protein [bacterium]